MNALRTPPGRRPAGWLDHLFAWLGCLASAAAGGAALVVLANIADRFAGTPTPMPLAVLWVYAIGLMTAPAVSWPFVPLGAGALIAARMAGFGGWLVAAAIGVLLGAVFGRGLAETGGDLAIRLAIGATLGFAYWKVIDIRTKPVVPAAFTDD